ncbi:MAG: hypothetical protein KBT31_00405, partial [Firmicutes bacterium]|nr:hypothetical protein [Candidatus Colimorpha enterica]
FEIDLTDAQMVDKVLQITAAETTGAEKTEINAGKLWIGGYDNAECAANAVTFYANLTTNFATYGYDIADAGSESTWVEGNVAGAMTSDGYYEFGFKVNETTFTVRIYADTILGKLASVIQNNFGSDDNVKIDAEAPDTIVVGWEGTTAATRLTNAKAVINKIKNGLTGAKLAYADMTVVDLEATEGLEAAVASLNDFTLTFKINGNDIKILFTFNPLVVKNYINTYCVNMGYDYNVSDELSDFRFYHADYNIDTANRTFDCALDVEIKYGYAYESAGTRALINEAVVTAFEDLLSGLPGAINVGDTMSASVDHATAVSTYDDGSVYTLTFTVGDLDYEFTIELGTTGGVA